MMSQRDLLRDLFDAAVQAALPKHTIIEYLPDPPKGRTIVVGCGKAAATMAKAFEECWEHPLEGIVVTPYGHSVPTKRVKVIEASHPVPDSAGMQAALNIQALVPNLTPDDLVVFLVSVGGSSRLTLTPKGISLDDTKIHNTTILQ